MAKVLAKVTCSTLDGLNSFIKKFKIKKKNIVNIETIKGKSSYEDFFRIWFWK